MSIHPTAIVHKNANLADDVEIGPYCVVGAEVTLGRGTRLISHAVVDGRTRIGEGCLVYPFASIGMPPQDLSYKGARTSVEIGDHTTIRECVTVNLSTNEGEVTRVGSRCLLMAYSHVAHTCTIGNEVVIANSVGIAGHVVVEDKAVLGGLCGIHQFVRVGTMCMLGGLSRVTQDCPPYMLVEGSPAEVRGPNRIALERRGVPPESREAIKKAYKILWRSGLSTTQALEKIRSEVAQTPEIAHLLAFVESSERGIIK